MAPESQRNVIRFPFRIADGGIPDLIHICRKMHVIDLQIALFFPESDSQGGWLTRPHSRGGPDVFVELSAPTKYQKELQAFGDELISQYNQTS